MSEEFRDEVRSAMKRHELEPDDLRDLAEDLRKLAKRWESMEDVI